MRVAFLISAAHGGGAEVVVRRWSEFLVRRGHDVFLYTYASPGSAGEVPPEVTHRHLPARSKIGKQLSLPRMLARHLRADRVDVLVSSLTYSNLVALVGSMLSGASPPVVIVEHNVPSVYLNLRGRPGRIQRALARRLYRRAAAAIGVSHAVGADLMTGYRVPAHRMYVLPNPVNEMPSPDQRTRARERRGLTVGFVGRISEQKCPLLFVDVLQELGRRGEDARGAVIGDGPLKDQMAAYAERAGVPLDFRGWNEPWTSAAADISCVVLASSIEGLGNVLIEAASAGIPSVAASSALGVADAILPGLTGVLALSSEPADLADAILAATYVRIDPDVVRGWLDRFLASNAGEQLETILNRIHRAEMADGLAAD